MSKLAGSVVGWIGVVVIAAVCVGRQGRADEPVTVSNPAELGFVKGYSWGWVGQRGAYASGAAAASMEKLADTGANWVCIAFATHMPTHDTPEIPFGDDNPQMVSDDEIRHAIDLARYRGLRVILKPVVNCADGTWRAWIRFYRRATEAERADGVDGVFDPWGESPQQLDGMVRDEQKWDQWWDAYTRYVVHYARLAETKQVPVLCIGCEMNSTEEFTDRWRSLIAQVEEVFSGQITYDVNHGRETSAAWLDAIDFLSVSAYHAIPFADGSPWDTVPTSTTPVEEIRAGLEQVREQMRSASAKLNKPILFIETGCMSVRGCAHTPWVYGGETLERPVDLAEQANYYEAMFETFWDEPWFMGWCWWDWPARLYEASAAERNRSFCAYGKPAEQVLRRWYARQRPAGRVEPAADDASKD